MPTNQMNEVINNLRRVALLRTCQTLPQDEEELTDGQLLAAYRSRSDETALATLVRRHASMVWGVCRRVLANYHDAEDAFQVTFLVLVRKAASIAAPELLANWLHGVAHQTALKARATTAKRKSREKQVTEMPEPAASQENLWDDLQPLLDQELSCLPDKYRIAIVLCDLEGKTRRLAAQQLCIPEGTLAARLARGRAMLAKRLARRGLAVSAVSLTAVLAQNAASAAPALVVCTTLKVANLVAAGKAAIPVEVAALAEGVMKTMLLTKLKTTLALLLTVALGLGCGLVCWQSAGYAQDEPENPSPKGQVQPNDNLTATLLALNKHYWEITARGDEKELAKFLADDFVSISVVGKYGKSDAVTACKQHRLSDWKIADPQVIRVSKDIAVLTHRYDCKVLSAAGQLLETRTDCRVTFVWANRDGGWVIVFCHDDHGSKAKNFWLLDDWLDDPRRENWEWRYLASLAKKPGSEGGDGNVKVPAADLEGKRYATPPKKPVVSSWPADLAAVIADKTYLDGFNYQNPGYVVENVDTFFYGGDTKALNQFLEKLAKVKRLRVSVSFSTEKGKVNRALRAGVIQNGKALGMPVSELDGEKCSWLVSVTPKDWMQGSKSEADARIVIFLGGKTIDMDALRLPVWTIGD
jgi:RNA polymerase sigma factor (sigma-70 family)